MTMRSYEARQALAISAGARVTARFYAEQSAAVRARAAGIAQDSMEARERAHKLMLQTAVRLSRIQARTNDRALTEHRPVHNGWAEILVAAAGDTSKRSAPPPAA